MIYWNWTRTSPIFRFSVADNSSGLGSEPSLAAPDVQAVAVIHYSKLRAQHRRCINAVLPAGISEVSVHQHKGGRGCGSA